MSRQKTGDVSLKVCKYPAQGAGRNLKEACIWSLAKNK